MGKTVIIGGVAAGASCAARLRRLREEEEIVLIERGDFISYANCGLPYHVGNVIKSRDTLLVTKKEVMAERFRVDVRVHHEAEKIFPGQRRLLIRNLETGELYDESYDNLVLATGSSPLRPRIPGIDAERIMTLWSVPDADRIRKMISEKGAKSAVVVGGGFIGLEMAENLHAAGLQVSIAEAADQVMAPLDPEMALLLNENIRENGVALYLGDGVSSFESKGDEVTVRLQSGREITADLVILSIGVRANSLLAKEAGLEVNARGGVVVDDGMHTSDPHIYAAGDVTEVSDFIFGDRTMVPLAGPANKQGRIVADNIAGLDAVYKGTQGSSVARVFDLTAASTGANEKTLKRRGLAKDVDYRTLIITQNSHAGYYPGALPMILKLIFSADGGKIYGAQIVGQDGVDKRIDTIGTAIRFGAGAVDLKDLELAYAPPYSSAKDPVNMAGFVAENMLKGIMDIAAWDEPDTDPEAVILDIREDAELFAYELPGAVQIPLGELRGRIGELDPARKYIVFCSVGVRAYSAARVLMQSGFEKVKIYPAGVRFYKATHAGEENPEAEVPAAEAVAAAAPDIQKGNEPMREVKNVSIDCTGLQCPGPIMEVFKNIKEMEEGDRLRVTSSDPGFAKDIVSWCKRTGNTLESNVREGSSFVATIRKGTGEAAAVSAAGPAPAGVPAPAAGVRENVVRDTPQGKTIIVFDGDMDKVLAAFVIANGALAMGRPVTMFFTFWGLTALRKTEKSKIKKTPMEAMFGTMLPTGSKQLGLSRMNMGGLGTRMMRRIMQDKNIDSLEDMMKKAMENGVKIIACSMSMDVMGIREEELIDGVEIGGVGTYLGDAEESNVNLFI